MKPHLKIPSSLLERALFDLERAHPFALERVGFLSCRQASGPSGPILFCYDYHPIADEDYVQDKTCGARIGERPIHAAMQRILDEGAAQIWVHTHGSKWNTNPSPLDREEGPRMLRSLVNVGRNLCNGWAVISEREATGQVWIPDHGPVLLDQFSVVGWPTIISRPSYAFHFPNGEDHHSRQGFLGDDAPRIIQQSKLGIVGLGGGGSHVNQQLAHIGFQNLVYADPDRIERTNLNRLVGATIDDARHSRLKVEIAERLFLSLQSDAKLDSSAAKWEEKIGALGECDIIFGCLDGFSGRRDLEIFCRSRMIPLVDIGMKVLREEKHPPSIFGQAVVSMPGHHCLRCLNVVTEENLAREAGDYGAGPQPQVVWPNGVLASIAVGFAVQILTGWGGTAIPPYRLEFNGFEQTMTPASNLLKVLQSIPCPHFSLSDLGGARFRRL